MTVMNQEHTISRVFEAAGEAARQREAFAGVEIRGGGVRCEALKSPEPAFYDLFLDQGEVYVSFSTPDRWLSQSIEADLMFTGDSLEDLIDEEAVDFGFDRGPLQIEHFRDENKQYVFRSRIPAADDQSVEAFAAEALACLLAYEAVFRDLGDMGEEADE